MKTKKLLCSGLMIAVAFAPGKLPAASAALGANVVADVPHADAVTDLGRAAPSDPIEIALTLNYRHADELERLVEQQSNPNSPLYGRFLSNEQFNAYFAPSAVDYARVTATLKENGFRIAQTYTNGTVVDAVGTISAADKLFSTDVHLVNQAGRGVRYANVLPAHEPAPLRGLVMSVSGLQTLITVKHALAMAHPGDRGPAILASPFADAAPQAAGGPIVGPVSSMTGSRGWGPRAFSQGYLFPEQFKSPSGKYYDGTGRKSGIVIDADFLDSDVAGFLNYFNVKRAGPTVRVRVDGGPRKGLTPVDAAVEATMDVEALVSNAPGTSLYVYEMPSLTDKNIIDTYNKVVSDNIVDTANSSFGGCELAQVSSARSQDHIALQAASKGITFHASSGDSDADTCGAGYNTVAAPASSPHFVAVGGTSLSVYYATGAYYAESVWNAYGQGTGGGVSQIFALPSWQHIPGAYTSGRNLPDVSFDADPASGTALYFGGTWNSLYNPLGGTSLSSPLFGAALTEVDQFLGRRTGLAAVSLYASFAKKGFGRSSVPYFHDITFGCNGYSSPGYCSHSGYDQASGIGSVAWYNFLTR